MEELNKLQKEVETLKEVDVTNLDVNQLTQVLEKLTQVLEQSESTLINSFNENIKRNDE